MIPGVLVVTLLGDESLEFSAVLASVPESVQDETGDNEHEIEQEEYR